LRVATAHYLKFDLSPNPEVEGDSLCHFLVWANADAFVGTQPKREFFSDGKASPYTIADNGVQQFDKQMLTNFLSSNLALATDVEVDENTNNSLRNSAEIPVEDPPNTIFHSSLQQMEQQTHVNAKHRYSPVARKAATRISFDNEIVNSEELLSVEKINNHAYEMKVASQGPIFLIDNKTFTHSTSLHGQDLKLFGSHKQAWEYCERSKHVVLTCGGVILVKKTHWHVYISTYTSVDHVSPPFYEVYVADYFVGIGLNPTVRTLLEHLCKQAFRRSAINQHLQGDLREWILSMHKEPGIRTSLEEVLADLNAFRSTYNNQLDIDKQAKMFDNYSEEFRKALRQVTSHDRKEIDFTNLCLLRC